MANARLRIVHVVRAPIGGIFRHIVDLATAQSDAGHDVGIVCNSLEGGAFRRHRERSIVELRGEDLRLAYVALTRARHQAVIWWIASWDSADSPLGRLLFAREDDGSIATSGGRPPADRRLVVTRWDGLQHSLLEHSLRCWIS